ncbi:MAG: hypothetical protein C0404_14600 [Verrucomicrobia bacterium]|nr:hypothetical protein [Verrucomicrobiota bacterium]
MKTAKMTIRLPESDLGFAKHYAREHGLSLTGLIQRYLSRLLEAESGDVPSEVRKVAGMVASEVDAAEEHMKYRMRKHV